MHHAFLYISLPLLHDCDGKCLISCFTKDVTSDNKIFFLFLSLNVVPKKAALGKFAYIRHFHLIHLKSDVLKAIAVIIAKTPYLTVSFRQRSHSTAWIFNQLKNLTGHFVHTRLFNIFALFTQNCQTVIFPWAKPLITRLVDPCLQYVFVTGWKDSDFTAMWINSFF